MPKTVTPKLCVLVIKVDDKKYLYVSFTDYTVWKFRNTDIKLVCESVIDQSKNHDFDIDNIRICTYDYVNRVQGDIYVDSGIFESKNFLGLELTKLAGNDIWNSSISIKDVMNDNL